MKQIYTRLSIGPIPNLAIALLSMLSIAISTKPAAAAPALKLNKGDHICLVGNALGERMQHANYWETLLHSRFPDHQLVVRNLCFPADEPYLRLRSQNFGSPDDHLTHSKADVILYFFGLNESFAGPKGVAKFQKDLFKLIEHNKGQKYNGKSAPRIVLISPIAAENHSNPHLPDIAPINKNIMTYAYALADVAKLTGVGFVNVISPTQKLFDQSKQDLTYNSVHLNDKGYRAFAPIFDSALFGDAGAPKTINTALKKQIDDKSFHWWHRYRAVNGYSIYGPRGKAGKGPDGHNNNAVMERERKILDEMTANRDQKIWALAAGKDVNSLPKDVLNDSNTTAFVKVISNVSRGKPGKQKGKLGTLDYNSPEAAAKQLVLAKGYQVNIFASEREFPELANPVSMTFDARGRLWVAVMPSYPHWKPKTKMDDKILILEDTNGDGKADKRTIFARGLHQPTGFEIGYGGAFIAEQPDIIFARDSSGKNEKADIYERVLFGFDSADSHHGIAAFEWGPGGALYFQEGTFKYSQVESPYGAQRMAEAGVWRFEPRSHRIEAFVSVRFANPWGHVFDRWGQSFIADASPGHNFWATPISGRVIYPYKHPGGTQGRRFKEKRKVPQLLAKRMRPSSGCELVSSRNFPDSAQGNYLLNNVIGFQGVLQHSMKEVDSGFLATEIEPLIYSKDKNFRPVDLQFGPDGALYICDWQNALIGHLQHNLRDPNRDHSHGRIWRITYKDRPLVKPPQIQGAPIAKLLDGLKVYEDRNRYRVRRELAQRDSEKVIAALKTWVANVDKSDKNAPHHQLEALWMYQTHNVVNEPLLKQLLGSSDYRIRAAATRVLSYWRPRISDPLALVKKLVNDKHPRVRLEAVRACSFFTTSKAVEIALESLNHPQDDYLKYTLDETMKTLEKYE